VADNSFTEVMHPSDPAYMIRRQDQIDRLLKLNTQQLDRQLRYMMSQPAPRDEYGDMSRRVVSEMLTNPAIPQVTKAGILGTTSSGSTSDGSQLIRQDLEPTLYALFVKVFPAWERLAKGPANGLVHAANQITAPDNANALGGTAISELATVTYVASTYVRATYPIMVMATGRGVSFKEC